MRIPDHDEQLQAKKQALQARDFHVDPNSPSASIKGGTELHSLIASSRRSGRILQVSLQARLDLGADINAQDAGGNTPLHFASWEASVEKVQLLLGYGAQADVPNHKGNTALHNALRKQSSSIAWMLSQAGADWFWPDQAGKTALDYWRAGQAEATLTGADAFLWEHLKEQPRARWEASNALDRLSDRLQSALREHWLIRALPAAGAATKLRF